MDGRLLVLSVSFGFFDGEGSEIIGNVAGRLSGVATGLRDRLRARDSLLSAAVADCEGWRSKSIFASAITDAMLACVNGESETAQWWQCYSPLDT